MGFVLYIVSLLVPIALSQSIDRPLKSGCPQYYYTQPCKCYDSPNTALECEYIDDAQILKKVFLNSTKYAFQEAHIRYSVLQYLPRIIFEKVPVIRLYLKNVTLSQLFDAPPTALQTLDTLHIENSKILRGLFWDLLEPLTKLRVLNIYYNSIKILGRDFSDHITKDLEQLSLYATGTKSIKPGTFVDFVSLEKLAIDACSLTELTRDIFPLPFNVKYLYFNDNNLRTLPYDLFSEMPHLQTIGLRNNDIAVIHSSIFINSLWDLEYLFLEGNPIICDCRLEWLFLRKVTVVSGKCSSPAGLEGTDLKDIKYGFLECN